MLATEGLFELVEINKNFSFSLAVAIFQELDDHRWLRPVCWTVQSQTFLCSTGLALGLAFSEVHGPASALSESP